MTVEQLKNVLHSQPFKPFTIHMGDGRAFLVKHPDYLSRSPSGRTLIVYGDRDPLYPVEMGVAMYRAIPNSALWVVPNGGHGPVFFGAAEEFARRALEFFKG